MSAAKKSWISAEGLSWAFEQIANPAFGLNPAARLVLLTLAKHRGRTNVVWPTTERLCAMTQLSVRAVQYGLTALVDAGLIKVYETAAGHADRRNAGRRQQAPRWLLLMAENGANNGATVASLDAGTAQKATDDTPWNGAKSDAHIEEVRTRPKTEEVQDRAPSRAMRDIVAAPAVLRFPIVGPGGPEWPLTQALVDDLAELFPNLDAMSEFRQALAWVKADLTRRKTGSGMRKFLTGWLTRSANQPRQTQTRSYDRGLTPAQATKRAIDRACADGEDNLAEALRIGREA